MTADRHRPLVDVGIPTYWARPFLAEAVESVLAQTLPDWGLLVSENGPGEEAVAGILEPFLADERITHSVAGSVVTVAANHTRAIASGSAPYVALLQDDDRWEPDYLLHAVDFLAAHPECGFVFCENVQIDEHGAVVGRTGHSVNEGVNASRQIVPRLMLENVVGAPTVVVMRRSAFRAVGGAFDEDYVMYDWEFWIRLALRFPVGFLREWNVAKRIHPGQHTMSVRLGEERLRLQAHVDALVERDLPECMPNGDARRERRASALLSAALDAIECGEGQRGLARIREAAALRPRSVLDRRVPPALAALALGGTGRRLLVRLRTADRAKSTRVNASTHI